MARPTVNQGVSGSSPEGGALIIKELRTNVAPFFIARSENRNKVCFISSIKASISL